MRPSCRRQIFGRDQKSSNIPCNHFWYVEALARVLGPTAFKGYLQES